MPGGAGREAERVARASYGRLLALLAAGTGDLAAAEDALADAFRIALETWPRRGLPDNPAAWLLVVARRRREQQRRRMATRLRAADDLQMFAALGEWEPDQDSRLPDRRLELLFACAHPAIHPTARTPLMLQTVLGLDAASIAAAFLVAPAAMGQRLVRAKAKIKAAGIPFRIPDPPELPARLDAVLDAIYASYGTGWDALGSATGDGLAQEALWLARLTADLLPGEPEAGGLLSLLLHCEARRAARRSPDGAFVPLSEQDMERWDRTMIAEAEGRLETAGRLGRVGRFQLEAALQSVHAQRLMTGRTDWHALATLYEALARSSPTVGVLVGQAAVAGEVEGPPAGLRLLDALPVERCAAYQPFWAVRADLLRRAGRTSDAAEAYRRATGLSADESVRRFLLERLHSLEQPLP